MKTIRLAVVAVLSAIALPTIVLSDTGEPVGTTPVSLPNCTGGWSEDCIPQVEPDDALPKFPPPPAPNLSLIDPLMVDLAAMEEALFSVFDGAGPIPRAWSFPHRCPSRGPEP